MRIFEYFCFEFANSSLQPLRCLAETEIRLGFKCFFFTVTVYNKKSCQF